MACTTSYRFGAIDRHIGRVALRFLVRDRIQGYILLMVTLSLVAIAAQVAFHLSIERDNQRVSAELQNQLARRDIGQGLYRRLLAIDALFGRLADLEDPRDLATVRGLLDTQLQTMQEALSVLQDGGTYLDTIGINLPGKDELRRPIAYHPGLGAGYVLEVLELAPKLVELDVLAGHLETLVVRQMTAPSQEKAELRERIAILLKATRSILLRGEENIGRILYETDENAHRLEQEIQASRRVNDRLRLWVIAASIVAVLGLLLFVLHRVGRIIEERHQAKRQLERTLANTEAILEAAPVGMILVDLEHRVVRANPAAAEIAGFSARDLLGHACHELICPAERGRCPVHDLGQTVDHSEKTVLTVEGGQVPVYKTVRSLVIDGQEMLLEAFIDITELKEARERFRLLLDSASEGIFGFDSEGRSSFVNPAAARLLGYDVQELQGHDVHEMIHHSHEDGATYPSHTCRMAEVLRTGTPSHVDDEVFWRKDGTCFPVEYTSTPLWRGDRIAGAVVTFTDVTVRRQAESALIAARQAAEQADRAKSAFLAKMSHEIRTPMNGVLGMAELLASTGLDPKQRKFLDTIERSAKTLLQIINDILDLSKIEAGKMDLDHAPFDLRELCEDALELLAHRAQEKGLEICAQVAAETPRRVVGDANRLRQVLINLLGNAIKFTDRGEVVLRVQEDEGGAPAGRLLFEVQDTGIGLDAAAQERIFEAFAQEANHALARSAGTGLGLAISRQLVRLMGGRIGVTSAPGEGSRFWFTARLPAAADRPQSADPRPMLGRRILIADRHPSVRAGLREQCSVLGADTEEAESTEQALGELQRALETAEPFHLVLFERALDGSEALTDMEPIGISPSPAVISMRPVYDVGRAPAELPADACELTKPVRSNALLHCLNTSLGVPGETTRYVDGRFDEIPGHRALGLKVLVAEDNPVNQLVAEEMLIGLGCEAHLAADGKEAVSCFAAECFDLVLMDCQMPIMDGYEASRKIRTLETAQSLTPVPIVALTANAMKGARENALAAGMDDYLTKPFTIDALAHILSKWGAVHQRREPATDTSALD